MDINRYIKENVFPDLSRIRINSSVGQYAAALRNSYDKYKDLPLEELYKLQRKFEKRKYKFNLDRVDKTIVSELIKEKEARKK